MQEAICVNGVGKQYRRYESDRPRTLQEAFARRFRGLRSGVSFWALRDISLTIPKGQMVGVIGANGAGKSTLLRLLGGVGRPERGEIKVQGQVGALLDLGAGFHPDLTGRENLYINGVISGLTRQQVEERFDEIVAFAELEEVIDSPLRTYSTGMRMRLGFSVAAHTDPDILLIDEVLAVGDIAFRDKCFQRIQRFRLEGKTIIFVSHDTSQVRDLCDQVVWLKAGQIAAQGDPGEVVNKYVEEMNENSRSKTARSHNFEHLALDNEKPIFIFASGHRTGSTLLQRLLNTCSSIMIWGEHDGALQELFWSQQRMLDWQQRFHSQFQTFLMQGPDQFIPNITSPKSDLEHAARTYLYTIFGLPAARLKRPYWGFKEIRYNARMALFLQNYFPQARFIHLTRNVVDCLISLKRWELSDEDWRPEWTIKSIQSWREINESFAGADAARLSHLMSVRFEDMVADPETFISQLADFLEMPRHLVDRRVFENKLHNSREKGSIIRPQITVADFSQSDRALLAVPELALTARRYGYMIEEALDNSNVEFSDVNSLEL